MKTTFLTLLLLLTPVVHAENFYVLVRGSNGWSNYRHEADIYHFAQLLLSHGVKREKMVIMTYNDIAYNPSNPKPGFIENQVNGTNVYSPNIKPDYTGKDVTPSNFLNLLENLKTTEEDNIWIYWTDHGATRLIAFPHADLYADDLMHTLIKMYVGKKYKNMFFYLEACESGSMFDGILSDDMRIYAVTAATPLESSYACCYDKQIDEFAGDEWSVNFLEDLDRGALMQWTFQDQFDWTRRLTKLSRPCQYGDLRLAKQKIGVYLAGNHSKALPTPQTTSKARNGAVVPTWELADPKVKERVDAIFQALLRELEIEKDFEHLQNMANSENSCHQNIYQEMDMQRYKSLMSHYPDRSYLKYARVLAMLSLPDYRYILEETIVQILERPE